jgi:hypothetical protein
MLPEGRATKVDADVTFWLASIIGPIENPLRLLYVSKPLPVV